MIVINQISDELTLLRIALFSRDAAIADFDTVGFFVRRCTYSITRFFGLMFV